MTHIIGIRRTSAASLSIWASIMIILLLQVAIVFAQDTLGPVNNIAWSIDGSRIAVAHNFGTVEILYTDGQPPLNFHFSRRVNDVAWNPLNLDEVAFSDPDGFIHILDISTVQLARTISGDLNESIGSISWSPDGTKIAGEISTGGGSGDLNALKVWDASTTKLLQTIISFDGGLITLEWNPQNPNQVLGVTTTGKVIIWDINTGESVLVIDEPDYHIASMAWSPDATQLALLIQTGLPQPGIQICSATTGQLQRFIETDMPLDMAWYPDERIAVSTGTNIKIFDASTGQVSESIITPRSAWAMAWSPNDLLAYGGNDGIVHVGRVSSEVGNGNERSSQAKRHPSRETGRAAV